MKSFIIKVKNYYGGKSMIGNSYYDLVMNDRKWLMNKCKITAYVIIDDGKLNIVDFVYIL